MSQDNIEDLYPLTPLQQGMLFHELESPGAGLYVNQLSCRLVGALDQAAFERAWTEVMRRHAVLRTALVWEDVDAPLQVVCRDLPLPLHLLDWSELPPSKQQRRFEAFLQEDAARAFDLSEPPLLRISLIRLGEGAFHFVLTHHHLLLDGWSIPILLQEAFTLYEAHRAGRPLLLPSPPPFRDFVAWLQQRDPAATEAFWRAWLDGLEAPTPLELARPASNDSSPGGRHGEQELRLAPEDTARLLAFTRREQVTLSTLVHAGWALLLARHSGQPEVLFGTIVAGRPPELPGTGARVGLHLNTLPLRVPVPGGTPVRDWLQAVQRRQLDLGPHEHTPLSNVQRWSAIPPPAPLFETLVVFENYPLDESLLQGLQGLRVRDLRIHERPHYPLLLAAGLRQDFLLKLSHDPARIDAAGALRLLEHLRAILLGLVARPDGLLRDITLLAEAERRLLTSWSVTPELAREDACLHELFEAQARRTPDAVALVADGTALTYRQLDARANQLARHLRALGIGPEILVAFVLERSVEAVVSILGILKAGGAYLPIEPSTPRERQAFILRDAQPRVLITRGPPIDPPPPGPRLLDLDREADEVARHPTEPLPRSCTPENLAYVVFTSGSTGVPKAVACHHAGPVNFIVALQALRPLSAGDACATWSNLGFDISVYEIFSALMIGGAIHVVPEAIRPDGAALAAWLARSEIHSAYVSPFHLQALAIFLDQHPGGLRLRRLMVGVEPIPESLLADLAERIPGLWIVNCYGPTEASIFATVHGAPPERERHRNVPMGRPIQRLSARVLDRDLQPVPVGIAGEVYLGGVGVVRGYLRRPDLTAERFIPDPFAREPGARLYATGDLARYLPDGTLEFIGRRDHQIKLRGFRVELGEIEGTLATHPDVREAVVVVREDAPGRKRLIAYVGGEGEDLAPRLTAYLRDRLPEHMVPSGWVVLKALPRTRSGKPDRKAFPAPEKSTQDFVAPRPGIEERLAEIWQQVLGVERVGAHDNFFELGGDSILSIQVVTRARQAGIAVTTRELFQHPTLSRLAAIAGAIGECQGEEAPTFSLAELGVAALEREVEEAYPLSPMQQGMLFHELDGRASNAYLLQLTCELAGSLDVDALERTWREMLGRHAVLRTAFRWRELREPVQAVFRDVQLPLARLDWRGVPAVELPARLERFVDEDRRAGFDLEKPPLLRVSLIRTGETAHRFLLTLHHVLMDGWSLALLVGEVFSCYEELVAGKTAPWPKAPPYREHIAWLRRQERAPAEAFWRAELAGFQAPTPLGVDRPARRSSPSEQAGEREATLPAPLTAALTKLARERHLTLGALLQGAWALLLARYSGERDIVFGMTSSGRSAALPGMDSRIGLFINTLPVRVRVEPDAALLPWLSALQARQAESRQYEHVPLAKVQRWSEVPPPSPLFETLLVVENYPVGALARREVGPLSIRDAKMVERNSLPLMLIAAPGQGLFLRLTYDSQRFDPGVVVRLLGHLRALLEGMADRPERRLGALTLLSPEEEAELLRTARPAQPRPVEVGALHRRFEAQVDRAPEACALTWEGKHLSYGELDARSNRLAHRLRRMGVGPDVPVALALERSLELVIGILGVLKAGGAYLPLDLTYPRERLAFMLADARARILVTQPEERERLPAHPPEQVVLLDAEGASLANEPDHRPDVAVAPDCLAYVIYTSGSTGTPKGAQLSHANVARLLDATHPWLSFDERDVWTMFHSYAFDFSVWELWGALAYGGRLVIVPYWVSRSPKAFRQLLASERVTVLNQTPSAFRLLAAVDEGRPPDELSLRLVIFGGEALEPAALRPWIQRHGDERPQLVNMYGITETTVHVTYRPLTRADVEGGAGSVIGQPIPDLELHVLDPELRPTPLRVPGELYVGGAGLARGYLDRPELTAERFVPHPFAREAGARLYRTGDRARRLEGGDLEYLGRLDHQVKIRGFRIELGEIEARLAQHPGIRESVAVVREDSPGEKKLVAYVCQRPGETLDPVVVRAFLGQQLPEHSLPTLVMLDALPLTPNGKVDRRALPAPEAPRGGAQPPRTPTEALLAEIFRDVLRLPSVGVDESFFALGGDSILSLQVASRAIQAGLPLTPRRIFEHPTVAQLAASLGPSASTAPVPSAEPMASAPAPELSPLQEDLYPLTPMQHAMLLHALQEPGSTGYINQLVFTLEGALDRGAFEGAWRAVMRRHPALRTSFHWENLDEPLQAVWRDVPLPLTHVDLRGLGVSEQQARLATLLAEDRRRGFDPGQAPLLRLTLVRVADEAYRFILTNHHVVWDGWSFPIILGDAFSEYEARRQGVEPVRAPPRPFRDYVAWLRRQDLAAFESFWRHTLRGLTAPLSLDLGRPRPGTRNAERYGVESLQLGERATAALLEAAKRCEVTLNALVQGAWALLLSRCSGAEDVVFGVTLSGRPPALEGVEAMVGLFVNTLPLRLRIREEQTALQWLREVQRRQAELFDHGHVPLTLVQRCSPIPVGTPLFETIVAFESFPLDAGAAQALASLSIRGVDGAGAIPYPLVLVAIPGRELTLHLHHEQARFDPATARRLLGHLQVLLEGLAEAPARRLVDLPLATVEEHRVMPGTSLRRADLPSDDSLSRRFEAQVRRTPDAVAVRDGDRTLTYAELNRRANRLARHLRTLGVGPEVRAGLCLARSEELVVAVLAVLKAGGAYVPLDPDYPPSRLAFLLADTGAPVLITTTTLLERLPHDGARIVCLDRDAAAIARERADELDTRPLVDHLAYVIYTSGSTGRPKGVQITHRNVLRLLDQTQAWYRFGPDDIWPLFHSYAFDVSVWELFGSLLSGGRLVIVSYALSRAPDALLAFLRQERVTVLNQTPSAFKQLMRADEDAGPGAPLSLRLIIFAGEALDPRSLKGWMARHAPARVRLVNMYGITETTVHVTYRPIDERDLEGGSCIGQPIPDLGLHVLDRHLRPVPPGVPGEICVGGDGLARGYLHRPDLTAERFVPDPFSDQPGARLYRSGDLARRLPDGDLEYLGRRDHQVKIRGFRVELGEIEAALREHPAIREAAVLAVQEPAAGDRLVAYVVGRELGALPEPELRHFLQGRLPGYMLPAAYVALDRLPLNENGKLDRSALPRPEGVRPELHGALVPPRTPVEELIAGIWAEVLRIDRVGVEDSFFELGGHSLLATQVISRLRRALGVDLPVQALFEVPTVAGLARRALSISRDATVAETAALAPMPRGTDVPPSFAQQRLWFLDQLEPGSPAYNMMIAVRAAGALDVELLERALNEVVRRHESLRTTFGTRDGRPIQRIAASLPVTVQRLDGRGLERAIAEESRRPFDLSRGPLLRLTVVKLGAREHALLLAMHHIISDGWSVSVLLRELGALYLAFSRGEPSPLPALPIQYADYALWQREAAQAEVLERQLTYWRERLAGAPGVLELPSDRPRPRIQSYRGARRALALAPALSDELRGLARREGATPFMVLLAAYGALLGRLAGTEELLVATPVANRSRVELEPLIGLFVNTLALRVELSGAPTFRALLARVRESCLGAYAHADVPFERLVEALHPERSLAHPPLVQVMFNLLNFEPARVEVPGLDWSPLAEAEPSSKLDLTLYAAEREGAFHFELVYNADLFEPERMDELLRQLRALLAQATRAPDTRVNDFSLVTAEAAAVLPDPTRALGDIPGEPLLDRLARQVARAPERVAVVDEQGTWTFSDLDERSGWVAEQLEAHGVEAGDVVAIHAARDGSLVAALWGVLKVGAAFALLDPADAPVRRARRLHAVRPAAVIELEAAGPLAPELEVRCRLRCPAGAEGSRGRGASRPRSSDALAYVAFTSGSTGEPKGIAATLRPLEHFLSWHVSTFGLEPSDRFSLLSGLAHDPLLRDVFTPLGLGATLCIPGQDVLLGGGLSTWMAQSEITIAHLTPATARLLGGPVPSLRYAFFGGDALDPADVERLRALAPSVTCVSFYGATETPQAMGFHVVGNGAPRRRVPLGRGIDGVQLVVLNRAGAQAGIGELGEIHIRTRHLAQGYLHDAELTRQRFLPRPDGIPLYRTGDLGRYAPGGEVDFAGRADEQLKLRGHRVEPGEIEAALLEHPGVRQAAVVAREAPDGDQRLVAYVVPLVPTRALAPDALRAHVRERLPEHLVPSAFVQLEALPLTPNRKVDRRALPAPPTAAIEGDAAMPLGPVEEVLAAAFAEVLRAERVGRHQHFFELGGHSLLATQVVARVRQALGVELPLRALFEAPTVAALARRVDALERELAAPPLVALPRGEQLPLSFAQERLWFLDRLQPGLTAYNMALAVRLEGALDVAALEEALHALALRHETLRTRFESVDGQPVQRIAGAASIPLIAEDLRSLPEPERSAEASRRMADEAERPFDLASGRLARAALWRVADEEHLLLLGLHHIVADGWSLGVLVRDLAELYSARRDGRAPGLAPLSVHYADFAAWQRRWLQGDALERQLSYWRQHLAGVPPELRLPADRPRPATPSHRGGRLGFALPAPLVAELEALGRDQGCTLFMTVLAALQALLHRYSGEDRVVVGTPVAGRSHVDTEGLIGLFANTLALCGDLSGAPSFRALLSRTRERVLGAFAHQDLPFEKLVEALQPARALGRTPLFQVMLVLQNTPAPQIDLPGLRLSPSPFERHTARFDLTLELVPSPGGLAGSLEYSADVFDASTARRILGHFLHLLRAAVAAPDRPVHQLPILDPEEQAELLRVSQPARLAPPAPEPLHARFEAQVDRRPDAIAVTFEGRSLTYAELDARANQLAHRLRRLGVGPEVRVALALERSVEIVVGILGVLKAGGAYVPLDPAHPRERLSFTLEDAGAQVLVAQPELAERLARSGTQVVILDPVGAALADEPCGRTRVQVEPEHLAYVIYTSGSTGKPKGVEVTHANVSRLFDATAAWFDFGPSDVWTLFHSYAFDFSVWELWGALLYGGRLVVVPYWVSRSPGELRALLASEKVTVLNQTPSAFRQLSAADEACSPGELALRLVIFGGEALELVSLHPWMDRHGDLRPRLVNMYGITETTVHVTYRPLSRADLDSGAGSVIGRPLPDLSLHVLDRHRQPVPVGVPGELCVGGRGLARGYLARPALTAERFVPDPFSAEPGARLYCSGDLARRLPDGDIEYLGRIDHQVKIRGFRIELGEIESALAEHPAIREAAVALHRRDGDEATLVAYVVGRSGPAPASSELRQFLQGRLPEYMLPTAWVALAGLPLTENGKVNRNALPPPGAGASAVESPPPEALPRSRLELELCQMFEDVLGTQRVGPEDDFFALGGHSLLAVRLVARIHQRFGRELPLASLFQGPTVAQLARLLRQSAIEPDRSPVVPIQPRGSRTPLFCIYPMGGHVFCYVELARLLGPDQPCYGIEEPALHGGPSQATPQAMAAALVEAVRGVQPHGPYHLCGWSLGGVVAFEMAQLLRRQGEPVALLALLDAEVPDRRREGVDDAELLSRLIERRLTAEALRRLEPDERLRRVLDQGNQLGLLPDEMDLPRLRALFDIARVHYHSLDGYAPAPYPERIVLFRALAEPREREGTLGWGATGAQVDVHEVPGSHHDLLQRPHVERLAAQLRRCLESTG